MIPITAAEIIAGDEDILIEILSRVPVKSLFRFTSVCKSWLALILNPDLSRLHTSRNHGGSSITTGIILRTNQASAAGSDLQLVSLSVNSSSTSPPRFKSFDFINDPEGIEILQSCNGLLLCSSFRKFFTTRRFYVCNPTARTFSTLPNPIENLNDRSSTILAFNLAFDPLKSPHYRVICVHTSTSSINHYQIAIYFPETRAWKSSGSPFIPPFGMVFENGVFCNGAVHWIAPSDASLCFNVEQERFGSMPVPPGSRGWGKRRFRYFKESHGHLHLIDVYDPRSARFQVLELESDYSRWFVKYNVDLDPMIRDFPEMVKNFLDPSDSWYYAFVILFLNRKEKEEDDGSSSILIHIPGKVLSYNLGENTFKEIYDLKTPWFQAGLLDAYQYIQSLACS